MIDKNFVALIGERNRILNILKNDSTLSIADRTDLVSILGCLDGILHRNGYREDNE